MAAVRIAIVLVLLVAARGAAAGELVLFLGGGDRPDPEEAAVLEAVAIYTRDLRIATEVVPGAAPKVVDAAAVAAVAALVRARGARLAFWYAAAAHGPAGTDVILYTVGGDGVRDTHALLVPGPLAPELYRVLALKLRAVLTGAAHAEPSAPMPRPAAPAANAASRAAAPASAAARPASAARPAAPRRRLRARAATGYWLTVPADGNLIRQGLAVEVSLQPRDYFEAHVGLDFTSRPAVTGAAGVAILLDLPIRLGARLLLRRGRFAIGLGPVLSVHVLSATGLATDGTEGRSTQATAGVGAMAVGRFTVTERMALELRLLLERTFPHTHFLIQGSPVIDGGSLLTGVGVAVSFVAP